MRGFRFYNCSLRSWYLIRGWISSSPISITLNSTISRLTPPPVNHTQPSFHDFLNLTDEELSQFDIAYLNLVCASGLPETQSLNPKTHLDILDRAAEQVEYNTLRCPWFLDNPEKYGYSFNLFRIHVMTSVLKRDFGFKYNQACISKDTTPRPIDTFIHGLLLGSGGNCASMPVFFTAVGRRLNYPLKLVKAKNHYFVRWDEDGGERFNIEVTNLQGFNTYPDDHYRQFPFPMTPEEEEGGSFLVSMSPRQELAAFLNERGCCWLWMKEYRHAVESLIWAKITEPNNLSYGTGICQVLKEWGETLQASLPPNFPAVGRVMPKKRRYPSHIVPAEIEQQIMILETIEKVLEDPHHQAWWESLRQSPNSRPPDVPLRIKVRA